MTVPNNPYPALIRAVAPGILRSIRQASRATSTDFGLLMAQAARESGFRADAQSSTSSAVGLFQFVDSTWLGMVRRFGDKFGIGDLARQITQTSNGKLVVADPILRQRILDLRSDPTLSAELAAEYAKQNAKEITQAIDRPLSGGDLYMAHFLGAAGATAFLKALDTKGDTIAAKLLPDAAAANPAIFYDSAGRAKTVGEIYQAVSAQIEKDAAAFDNADMPSWSQTAANGVLGDASGHDASPPGHALDWSGVKLSAPMLAMLNVVALAALKMAENGGGTAPARHPQTKPAPTSHSI